ncbi:unnamed protein product [Clonostachys chloroleuca]|uniref:Reverse transcriptase domain-containing protein n=1 Tax=Clonostachys chloroleuca TaxID=1926264 RepID=A0AA35QEP2_9HYPO|nr:unnamed protein product [Clonostachys chloroleuca]
MELLEEALSTAQLSEDCPGGTGSQEIVRMSLRKLDLIPCFLSYDLLLFSKSLWIIDTGRAQEVVWRDDKPRVVVDLRKVNMKVVEHAYPLPLQDDILTGMQGATVFSVVDLTKGFFQQGILPEDRWKTTFVTPHRGLERLTVSTMGLLSSPAFFQQRMDNLFRKYLWEFVLVYVDDIIIFSRSIEDHVRHLDICLGILERAGCTLSLGKCHFAQPGLKALGHFVSRLGLSTLEEKTKAIKDLAMPRTLKELETGLGLMGYYRKFVEHYSAISEPLVKLKAMGFRKAPPKNPQREKYANKTQLPPEELMDPDKPVESERARVRKENEKRQQLWKEACRAWEELKDKLVNAVELAFPDFSKPFELHVDGSKERGFGAALHQRQDDNVLRPILFLSKTLSDAEMNYWATELETGALIWALQKLTHYLDHAQIDVVTDHTAIRDTFNAAGSGKPKGKYRLVNWRLYLEKWKNQIMIKYRAGKSHVNADALSRMKTIAPDSTPEETPVKTWVITRQRARELPRSHRRARRLLSRMEVLYATSLYFVPEWYSSRDSCRYLCRPQSYIQIISTTPLAVSRGTTS